MLLAPLSTLACSMAEDEAPSLHLMLAWGQLPRRVLLDAAAHREIHERRKQLDPQHVRSLLAGRHEYCFGPNFSPHRIAPLAGRGLAARAGRGLRGQAESGRRGFQ